MPSLYFFTIKQTEQKETQKESTFYIEFNLFAFLIFQGQSQLTAITFPSSLTSWHILSKNKWKCLHDLLS